MNKKFNYTHQYLSRTETIQNSLEHISINYKIKGAVTDLYIAKSLKIRHPIIYKTYN